MPRLKTAATATVLAATGLLATACGHAVYVPSTTHHVVVHHTVVHHVVVHHVVHHTGSLRKR